MNRKLVQRKHWIDWQTWLICVALATAILAAFWPALHCNFLRFDDQQYIFDNSHIANGINWPTVVWAFKTGYCGNWFPVTWLSHALDVQLFGLRPHWHHAMNVAIHAVNSILLFLVVRRLTGAQWKSAAVAALFALHPLHVESVAWISERKDLLSTFFWLLTVAAYVSYCQQLEISWIRAKLFYALVFLCFALALMSKSMVVTLPVVLLLLDYWPLGRFGNAGRPVITRLLLEKLPLVLLVAATCWITFVVQGQAGWVVPFADLPLDDRLENVPVAFVRYVAKTFWPLHLSVFYAYPRNWPVFTVLGAIAFLAGVTWWVMRQRTTRPYLAVGWLWFLVMLVPVIGVVQVGLQSMADRYSYLPIVGIFIMVVWRGSEMVADWSVDRWMVWTGGALVVCLCAGLTWRQAHYWMDDESLMVHAADLSTLNYNDYYALGVMMEAKGETDRAADYYRRCLQANPYFDELGLLMKAREETGRAADYYPQADPYFALASNKLGCLLLRRGEINSAIGLFKASLQVQPVFAEACSNLGCAYMSNGLPEEAAACFQNARAMAEAASP
jgi:hypothetical protein